MNTIEALESRRLCSVALSSKGTLIITGTSKADQFNIDQQNSRIVVTENGSTSSFLAKAVKRVAAELAGGNDRLTATDSVLKTMTLAGGKGNDTIRGGGGQETIEGQSGDDTINPGPGFFEIFGGFGTDTADFSDATSAVLINLDNLFNDGAKDNAMSNVHDDFEVVSGSPKADEITGSVYLSTLMGNGGDDIIKGKDSSELIVGGAGDDSVDGGAGDDTVIGGKGHDIVSGGNGSDQVQGGEGSDLVHGMTRLIGAGTTPGARDSLYGGPGRDWLYADAVGFNSQFGEAGDDVIYGGSEADRMEGGDGNDKLLANAGNDTLFGGAGNDGLDGSDGDDEVHGGAGNDTLIGGKESDKLFGDSGDDFFVADDATKDTLTAGSGTDLASFDPLDVSDVEFI